MSKFSSNAIDFLGCDRFGELTVLLQQLHVLFIGNTRELGEFDQGVGEKNSNEIQNLVIFGTKTE